MRRNGFTLVELAVVIAVIAILAAAALPRIGSAIATAERAKIQDMTGRINTAAGFYAVDNQGATPTDFSTFVTTGIPVNPHTLSTRNFGNNTCAISPAAITGCSFKTYSNVQWVNANGQISVTGSPCCGNTLPLD